MITIASYIKLHKLDGKKIRDVIETFTDLAIDKIVEGEKVSFFQLGSFELIKHENRLIDWKSSLSENGEYKKVLSDFPFLEITWLKPIRLRNKKLFFYKPLRRADPKNARNIKRDVSFYCYKRVREDETLLLRYKTFKRVDYIVVKEDIQTFKLSPLDFARKYGSKKYRQVKFFGNIENFITIYK